MAVSAFSRMVECGTQLAKALVEYGGAVADLPPDYWRMGRAWQWREALSAALQDPSAIARLCVHFSSNEERNQAQRVELRAVQARLEGDLASAQHNVRDMHAALLAASDPTEPRFLEEALTVAHSSWARHADRASLGHAACAVQLCDTLSRVLGVSLPESPGTKELALLKAAPEEWSAPNHAELLSMVAQVWGVGPQTSRMLQVCIFWCSLSQRVATWCCESQGVAMWCSVLQCVSACCSKSQQIVACCNVLQRVAACCSELQRVAAGCSVLQRVATWRTGVHWGAAI